MQTLPDRAPSPSNRDAIPPAPLYRITQTDWTCAPAPRRDAAANVILTGSELTNGEIRVLIPPAAAWFLKCLANCGDGFISVRLIYRRWTPESFRTAILSRALRPAFTAFGDRHAIDTIVDDGVLLGFRLRPGVRVTVRGA